MGAALLITFRETLEAALVIGLILAFLGRAGLGPLRAAAWIGALVGLAFSCLAAYLFIALVGVFEGRAEQLFEGTVMLAGALLLTTLIVWLNKGKVKQTMEERTAASAGAGGWWGIALLVFVSVFREGIETVIFIGSSLRGADPGPGIGAMAGIALAGITGFAFFRYEMRIGVKGFFAVTNVLLVLFAAGLIGRSVGEFNEAALLPAGVEHLWDLSVLVPEERGLGSFMNGLFGYVASPSLAQAAAYVSYLGLVAACMRLRGHQAAKSA